MSYLFNKKTSRFLAKNMVDDGSYGEIKDSDLIIPTDDEMTIYHATAAPQRKLLGTVKGRPAWVDAPEMTPEEVLAEATSQRSALKAKADSEIEWRQDAVDSGSPEGTEANDLAKWKEYRISLMRLDISTGKSIEWPAMPD
ncbi:hypothetical protein PL78_06175 [Yersinia entomophaga]|uniref:Tail fiber assembly protein n=1 Tax=Yersinia entomophaga TaxID=935293 RepID=A0ABN4PV81_YERET|nr:tail fiber assembly protein [Yersinia entomophaga]ANI29427.1 hypothetical protein PL78_06175 [Yersinia entomophaga]OWF84045.1 hypothetical protein B4914_19485 [Yersinia entomophaga]